MASHPYMVVFGDLPSPQAPKLQALRGRRSRTSTPLDPHFSGQSKIQGVGKETLRLDRQLYKILGTSFQSATPGGVVALFNTFFCSFTKS